MDPGASGTEAFCLNSVVLGHHIYKDIWSSVHGKELHCKCEVSNVHDLYAVFANKHGTGIVGYLPKQISIPCHLILRNGGSISCIVNGRRSGRHQYSRYYNIAILKLQNISKLYFRKWLVIFEIFENNFIRKFLRIR